MHHGNACMEQPCACFTPVHACVQACRHSVATIMALSAPYANLSYVSRGGLRSMLNVPLQPPEVLQWMVALLDANGHFSTFRMEEVFTRNTFHRL